MSRPKKPYQIPRRRANNSKHVYYVAFRLPDGTVSSPRSSGQTSKGAAETWAIQQINTGKVPTPQSPAGDVREELIACLTDFWDYDKPKYVRGKLARRGTIGRVMKEAWSSIYSADVARRFQEQRS